MPRLSMLIAFCLLLLGQTLQNTAQASESNDALILLSRQLSRAPRELPEELIQNIQEQQRTLAASAHDALYLELRALQIRGWRDRLETRLESMQKNYGGLSESIDDLLSSYAAWAMLSRGQHKEAVLRLEQSIQDLEQDAFVAWMSRQILGEHLATHGQPDQALTILKPVTKIDVRQALPFRAHPLAQAFDRLGRLTGDVAFVSMAYEQILEDAFEKDPLNLDAGVMMYVRLKSMGQQVDAQDLHDDQFQKKMSPHPDFDAFEKKYTQTIAFNPMHEVAMVGMVIGKCKKWRYEAASEKPFAAVKKILIPDEPLKLLKSYLKILPQNVTLLSLKAAVLEAAHQHDQAAEVLSDLQSLHPQSGKPWFYQGVIKKGSFHRRDALALFAKALEKEERNYQFLAEGIALAFELGEIEMGTQWAERFVDVNPFHVSASNRMKLGRSMQSDFEVIEAERFALRLRHDEVPLFKEQVVAAINQVMDEYEEMFGYQLEHKLNIDIFPDKNDFDVRVFGLPAAPALGACFGECVAMPSSLYLSQRKEPWGSVLRHEISHAYTLGMAGPGLNRWFTEGFANWQERVGDPSWEWELRQHFDRKLKAKCLLKRLTSFQKLDEEFQKEETEFYYQWSSHVVQYIHDQWGMEAINHILDRLRRGALINDIIPEVVGQTASEFDDTLFAYAQDLADRRRRAPLFTDKEAKAVLQNPDLSQWAALIHWERGDLDQCLISLGDNENQDSSFATMIRGHVAFDQFDLDQADRYYRKALSMGEKNALLKFQLGRIAYEKGRLENALEWFRQSARDTPRLITPGRNPHYQIWRCLDELKKPLDEKIDAVENLVAINHRDVRMRLWLAQQYRKKGQWEKVRVFTEQVLHLQPFAFEPHDLMGRYWEQQSGDQALQSAIDAWNMIINLTRYPEVYDADRFYTVTDAEHYVTEAHRHLFDLHRRQGHLSQAKRHREWLDNKEQELKRFRAGMVKAQQRAPGS